MGGVAWTEEEDNLLRKCIEQHGEGKWHRVPLLAGINRCRKSCRLRWLNYLRPNINRGRFTEEERELIIKLHKLLGNRWSLIAGRLPGRTANDVKNFWNCHLCKKLNADNHVEVSEQAPKVTEEPTPWQHNLDTSSLQLSNTYYKAPPPPNHEIQPQDVASTSKQGFTLPLQYCSATAVGDAPGFDQMIPLRNNNGIFGSSSEGGILMVDDLPEEYELEEIQMMGEQPSQWDLDDLIMDMDVWSRSS